MHTPAIRDALNHPKLIIEIEGWKWFITLLKASQTLLCDFRRPSSQGSLEDVRIRDALKDLGMFHVFFGAIFRDNIVVSHVLLFLLNLHQYFKHCLFQTHGLFPLMFPLLFALYEKAAFNLNILHHSQASFWGSIVGNRFFPRHFRKSTISQDDSPIETISQDYSPEKVSVDFPLKNSMIEDVNPI